MLLNVGLNRLLVELLVERRVIRVHVDLVLAEGYAFGRLLVEDDVKCDLIIAAALGRREHRVHLHLLPGGPAEGVVLHRLVQEVEGGQVDHDVAGPAPCALFDLLVEGLHRVLPARRAVNCEHEHTCQHLIEDDAHSPNVNLVTVAGAAAPVRIKLLWRHHERRAFEGVGSSLLRPG